MMMMSATAYTYSPVFGNAAVTIVNENREPLQYQARRLRGNCIKRPHSRKKGRWMVVAVHRLPVVNHADYTRMDMEPMSRTEATKVANTLNTLNNLPLFER